MIFSKHNLCVTSHSNILTQISQGERYTVLARTPDNQWVKINANGVLGWVNTTYVTVSNLQLLPVERNLAQLTGVSITASPYTVNIRLGPGTQFRDIGNLRVGDTAQVVGRNANATWWKVNYNDVIGWVSGAYTNLEDDASLSQIPVVG